VCFIRHLGQQQQIIPTEAVGGFPLFAVLVEAGERCVEANAFSVSFLQTAALMAPSRTSWMGFCLGVFFGIGK
jgi:hypothetical protein